MNPDTNPSTEQDADGANRKMRCCPRCEGLDVIKFGFNYSKVKDYKVQRYACLSCKKMFNHQERLPKNHVSSEIISLCLDLYVKGMSYRVIRQQILEQFKIKVSHVTIHAWIQKYADLMKKYVDTLKPELSAVFQMDETFIPFKGTYPTQKGERTNGNWCWVCIDTVTRYVLDMYLAVDKELRSGQTFFERIKDTTIRLGSEPKVISTDGNITYESCIKRFYPEATHLRLKMICLKPNTSFIERYNGTIKNRTKTMRCFGGFYPCQNYMTAFQIYYNFLRPHMALKGKTPAQAAGITTEFPQRWISLIRNALISC